MSSFVSCSHSSPPAFLRSKPGGVREEDLIELRERSENLHRDLERQRKTSEVGRRRRVETLLLGSIHRETGAAGFGQTRLETRESTNKSSEVSFGSPRQPEDEPNRAGCQRRDASFWSLPLFLLPLLFPSNSHPNHSRQARFHKYICILSTMITDTARSLPHLSLSNSNPTLPPQPHRTHPCPDPTTSSLADLRSFGRRGFGFPASRRARKRKKGLT